MNPASSDLGKGAARYQEEMEFQRAEKAERELAELRERNSIAHELTLRQLYATERERDEALAALAKLKEAMSQLGPAAYRERP